MLVQSFTGCASIDRILTADEVYQFLSQIGKERFIVLINALLWIRCRKPNRRTARTFILDGSAIPLDQSLFKKVRETDLETKEYRWGYSTTKGYYLGFKLTLAVEHPSLVPVAILIPAGSPHDSKPFPEVVNDLKRRKVLRVGDTVICDKGYCAHNNYATVSGTPKLFR